MARTASMTASMMASAALLLLPAVAFAGESTPRIDNRQEHQRQRIEQGVKSGSLTRRETRSLVHGQRHVQKMENRAVADGEVTKRERVRIEHAQNKQSRNIFRQKHDRQRRR